ncbi:SURF1 family protein [Angustibacter aerolatus]
MLRTALRPRWLALLGAVLLVCVAFGFAGSWQLGVARDKGAERERRELASAPRVPVQQVAQPQRSFPAAGVGRRVSVEGAYDATRQVLVGDRSHPGVWVVTAVQVEGGWLPVVRGVVASSTAPVAPPSGTVRVEGVLQPDEAPPEAPVAGAVLSRLDAADLANRWGTPIYNGYVVLTAERATGAAGDPVQRVPAPAPAASGIAWRNAAYAVQWWVFAAFALVLWWKMVRQDHEDAQRALEPGRPGPQVQGVR